MYKKIRALKDWFRECAGTIYKLTRPVEWVTPLGLPVMQPYMKQDKKFDQLFHVPIKHRQVIDVSQFNTCLG